MSTRHNMGAHRCLRLEILSSPLHFSRRSGFFQGWSNDNDNDLSSVPNSKAGSIAAAMDGFIFSPFPVYCLMYCMLLRVIVRGLDCLQMEPLMIDLMTGWSQLQCFNSETGYWNCHRHTWGLPV